MRISLTVLFALTLVFCSNDENNPSPKKYAIKMADSDIQRNPEGWMLDFSTEPKWNYCHGLVCSAIEQVWKNTGDEKFYYYIKGYADTMIDEKGNISTYQLED